MLGSVGGVCSGPVSWWCSEVLRCSPKVAPDPSPSSGLPPMAECEQCSTRFNLLRRKRECAGCKMVYCGSCLKRGMEGTRRCNKCVVLTQWPLDMKELMALRVKDLRQFLHSQRINTTMCTEKRDLIDLVTRYISSQHRTTPSHRPPPPTTTSQRPSPHPPHTTNNNPSKHRSSPRTPAAPHDDGIRVRPSSNSSMGSIRVRPLDSIRVRPGRLHSPDPNTDAGIRVFASEQHVNSQDSPSTSSPASPSSDAAYPEGEEEECSRCPSDWTASCCSLDSCHNGTVGHAHHCPHHQDSSSPNSGEWVFVPEQNTPSAPPRGENQGNGDSARGVNNVPIPLPHHGEVVENGRPAGDASSSFEPTAPPQEQEERPSFEAPTASSSSSASSSAPTSAVSSPEPTKGVMAGIVALEDLKSVEEIHKLSVRQCKELLSLHRVTYTGVREKSELLSKIKILWEDYRTSRQELENLPEELICKICMDSAIDCVLLECGHMVSCTQCGKQMSECPLCRQYVVRVVRTFRA